MPFSVRSGFRVRSLSGPLLPQARMLRPWLFTTLAACALALLAYQGHRNSGLRLPDAFLLLADMPVLVLEGILLILIFRWAADGRFALPAWPTGGRPVARLCAGAGLAVLLVGLAGWPLVMHRYPLSYDEFMVAFDADSFRRGWLLAPVPAAWRSFVPALQPYMNLQVPGHEVWGSDYLPLNAALHALATSIGSAALAGPLLNALSVWLTFAIARKQWPERPDAAAVAALLLASSSQLLIAGMTLYAMPAHLAFNLLWLRLYQEDRRWADAAALLVGWAACGLHQLVFHPLFVAPFVIQAMLDRRWGRASLFAAGYAAIGLFWIMYFPLVFRSLGLAPALGKAGGPPAFALHVLQLLRAAGPVETLCYMAENLVRFIAWENPLTMVLMLAGVGGTLRTRGLSRNLLAGMGLTLAAMTLVMPDSGHGWGYRYLHGFLGAACLVATDVYLRLTATDWTPRAAQRALILSVLASLLLLAPLHAMQAFSATAPYARAHRLIAADKAPIVVLDKSGIVFSEDLIRNAPDLANRPLVLDLAALSADQVDTLCRRGEVHVFDKQDGRLAGLPEALPGGLEKKTASLRARMRARRCALVHVTKS